MVARLYSELVIPDPDQPRPDQRFVAIELTVAGRAGVPADASAVMWNVTAVNPSGNGYITVFPSGTSQPLASNLNYRSGDVIPNAVLAKIGTGGKVCIYTLAAADIVIDVNGYVQ